MFSAIGFVGQVDERKVEKGKQRTEIELEENKAGS